MKFAILLSVALFLFGTCNTKKTVRKVEIPEEELLSESFDYSSIGLIKLSEYGFFEGELSDLKPAEGILPYDLNSPLFTDYAMKSRYIALPSGKKIGYHATDALKFPVGTTLIKNFYYTGDQLSSEHDRLIETRLLIHEKDGWKALPYIWNEEQTEAFLEITGGEIEIMLNKKGRLTYAVPTMNQCKSCHEKDGRIVPIGPSARQLNKRFSYKAGASNQLLKWRTLGWIEDLPDYSTIPRLPSWETRKSGNLDERARAYLEINCGHCHRPEGPGKNSGLDLTTFSLNELTLGIFKGPVAAGKGSGGLKYDIHPGKPEQSILLYRMESTEPAVKMPELGRNLVHEEGVELVREWIRQME